MLKVVKNCRQFAAGGKEVKKKHLASIAMSYGYVYVIQIALGYDMNQAIKALIEEKIIQVHHLLLLLLHVLTMELKKVWANL